MNNNTEDPDNLVQLLPEAVTDRKTLVAFTTAKLLPLVGVGATSPAVTMAITTVFMPLASISCTRAASGDTVMRGVMVVSVLVMVWSCTRQITYSRRVRELTESRILADAPSFWIDPLVKLTGYRHQLSVNIWAVTLVGLMIFTIIGITGSVSTLICCLTVLPLINCFRIRRNGAAQVERLLNVPTGRREYIQMINRFEHQIQKEDTDEALLDMMSQIDPPVIHNRKLREHRQAVHTQALADDPLVTTTIIRNEAELRGWWSEKWL